MNGSREEAAPAHFEPDDGEGDSDDVELDAREDIARETRSLRSVNARTLFHFPRGEADSWNSTRSLYENDVVYHWIGGRRYCGEYYMPNDEDEQTRLQMLHGIYLWLFDNELTLVPLTNPTKILDIGTGTGEWAMAMGEEYPEAEVIGTDIAKIQPSAVPLNVFMEIDDADIEGGWTWNEDEFDMVHFRYMAGAFRDWNHIYKEAYRVLKPGGWIEVLDFDQHSQFRTFFAEGDNAIVLSFLDALAEAQKTCGRPRSVAHLEPEALASLGFIEVEQREYDIPMGSWPSDPELKAIGKQFLLAQLCVVEAMCMRPLVETLGWDEEDVRMVCCRITERVRSVARDAVRAKGLGFRLKVLMGRKPEESGGEGEGQGQNGEVPAEEELSVVDAVRGFVVDTPAMNGEEISADAGERMDIDSKNVTGIEVRSFQPMATAGMSTVPTALTVV